MMHMRVTITFKDTLASLLIQYASVSNLSMASVVRLALSEFFERQAIANRAQQGDRTDSGIWMSDS